MSLPLSLNQTASRSKDLEGRLTSLANGGPHAIGVRLQELDREWSAGRAAKGILAVCILVGTILTLTVNWWWVVLPVVSGLLLLQYMFDDTSVPVQLMRRLGLRTRAEIEQEKLALRALRGDFRTLPTLYDIEDEEDISRLEGEGGIVIEAEERKVDCRMAVKEVLEAAKAPAAEADQSGGHKS